MTFSELMPVKGKDLKIFISDSGNFLFEIKKKYRKLEKYSK